MKLYLENEVIEALLSKVKLFVSESNAVVELTFGVNGNDTTILNTLNVIAGGEQVQYAFQTAMPEEITPQFEVKTIIGPDGQEQEQKIRKPLLHFYVKVSDFLATVGNLASLKEKIFIAEQEGKYTVGVSQAILRLEVLAHDQIPTKICFNRTETVLQVAAGVNQLVDTLRVGGCMTHSDAQESRGLGNVVFAVHFAESEDSTYSGQAKVYSSDGFAIAKGECAVMIPAQDKSVFTRLEEFKKSQGREFFASSLPRKAVKNLLNLLAGQQEVQLWFTKKHVCVIIGKTTIYTFTQGANLCQVVFFADQWQKTEKAFQLVVDTEGMKTKIDLLNKLSTYKGSDRMPIRISAAPETKALLVEIAGKAEIGKIQVPLIDMKLEQELEIYFAGNKLAEVISSLKKGNLSISSTMQGDRIQPIMFANGDLQEIGRNVAFLTPVKGVKDSAEETAEDTADAETAEE